jgi:CHAT domain-containing protein
MKLLRELQRLLRRLGSGLARIVMVPFNPPIRQSVHDGPEQAERARSEVAPAADHECGSGHPEKAMLTGGEAEERSAVQKTIAWHWEEERLRPSTPLPARSQTAETQASPLSPHPLFEETSALMWNNVIAFNSGLRREVLPETEIEVACWLEIVREVHSSREFLRMSLERLCAICADLGMNEGALCSARQLVKSNREFESKYPPDARDRMSLVSSMHRLALSLRIQGHTREAAENAEEALHLFNKWAKEHPREWGVLLGGPDLPQLAPLLGMIDPARAFSLLEDGLAAWEEAMKWFGGDRADVLWRILHQLSLLKLQFAVACADQQTTEAKRSANLERAIAAAEAARSRQLLARIGQALGPRLEDSRLSAPERKELLEAWWAMRVRLRAAGDQVETLRGSGGRGEGGAVVGLAEAEARLEACEQERALLLDRIWPHDPDFDEVRGMRTATFVEALKTLGPKTVCLYYVLTEAQLHGFVLRPGEPVQLRLLLEHEQFNELGELWRQLVTPPPAPTGPDAAAVEEWEEAKDQWQRHFKGHHMALLGEISRELLGPLEWALEGAEEVLVVADAAAMLFPFAALPLGKGVLADRCVVRHVSSLSLLRLVQQRTARPGTGALVVAVPDPGRDPQDSGLEYAHLELSRLRQREPQPEVLDGYAATPEEVLSRTVGKATVHFCCHGTAQPQATGQSGLMLSRGKVLSLDQIYRVLNLRGTHRVTLNACQSGQLWADGFGNFEGLVSGFLFAGAAQVLGTLWPVADLPSALLMLRFDEEVRAGCAGPEALRRAADWLRGKDPAGLVNGARVAGVLAEHVAAVSDAPEELKEVWQAAVDWWWEHAEVPRPYESPFYWAGHYISGDVPERRTPTSESCEG